MDTSLHEKCLKLLFDFDQNWYVLVKVNKHPKNKTLQNSVQCELHCSRTDSWTDRQNEANRCFLQLQHKYVPKLLT